MSRPVNPGGRVYNDRPPERRNKNGGGGGRSPGPGKYARAAEAAARSRGGEDEGRNRRRSLATAAHQTLRKGANIAASGAKSAGNALSRWFGVVDAVQMQDMQQNYNRRKMTMLDTPQRNPAIGHHQMGAGGPTFRDMSNPEAIRAALKQATAESSSDDDDDDRQIVVNPKNFTRDLHVGLGHYRKIRRMERQRDSKPGWFGGDINRNRRSLKGYRTVRGRPAPKKHSQVRDQTLVQLQLHSMSTFYPYFIYAITAAQLLITLAMCVHSYTTDSFANVGIASVVTECDLYAESSSELECPFDFAGTRNSVVNRTDEFNWSIGPSYKYLLNYGAKFTPCMRSDTGIELAAARTRTEECVWQASIDSTVGYQCDESLFNTTGTNGYACCRLQVTVSTPVAGMTSYDQCEEFHTAAGKSFTPSNWVQGEVCDPLQDFITLRPCCGGIDETCELTTEEQCAFKAGFFHSDKMLCSDTMCLDTGCKFWDSADGANDPIDTVSASTSLRNVPDDPNQWYRFMLPLFIHGGLLHVGVICAVQYYAGKSVESQAGFLRTFLIYFISGIGGNMISAIFSPKTISMGADPAVYGLLGVMLVELFQAWQIIPSPLKQLAKLTITILVSLLIGTFPYVDNWSHVGGFFFGIVSGIVFLPYITFGQWDARRKKILLFICMPLLFVMCMMAFLTFYLIQNSEFCTWCKYLNCIPYTDAIDCSLYY